MKMSRNSSAASVYLNPRFKNIHINPKFIQGSAGEEARPNKIHINPNFIPKSDQNNGFGGNASKSDLEKPLVCTRNKLIRSVQTSAPVAVPVKPVHVSTLRKIGLRKLVRKVTLPGPSSATGPLPVAGDRVGRFNVVRGHSSDLRPKVVSTRFRLKRVASFSDVLTPKKVIASKYRLRRIGTTSSSSLKKDSPPRLCDINGVFYKSARQQLFKSQSPMKQRPRGNALYIRGERFLVTGNGNRLQRATEDGGETAKTKPQTTLTDPPRKRLDIGGVTFVASDKGTFERTNSHLVRNYLSHAKQKSLQILSTANQFRKTNVPCMIYRRLGKCRSHERGKCNKLHNPDQVAVCSKFLKGLCLNPECLLSHRVCLTKMPVCRFFLDACCTTANCPYLHKKVSEDADVCVDFQRGFCPLAEQCPKRHEHQPATTKNKRPPVKGRRREVVVDKNTSSIDYEDNRYYSKETTAEEIKPTTSTQPTEEEDPTEESLVPRRRPPIGTLPAFIPL